MNFSYVRIEREDAVPPFDECVIDVAVMDMNHRWPNMGHDAIISEIRECATPYGQALDRAGLAIRVLSYDVRSSVVVPEEPGRRFLLYLGTGGPGHIDPARNDGESSESQGIVENPAWERPLHRLLDAIRDHEDAALLAVCHTFGLLCRWAGAADAVLRGPEKGGKSSGLVENVLTREALEHPWFARFAAELPDGRSLTVIDSRFFDLMPRSPLPSGALPVGMETNGHGNPRALTMIELARDRGGVMPRIFGVNHHPEVVDRAHAMRVLERMRERGTVTDAWYQERADTLGQQIPGRDAESLLRLTSEFTFLLPLQFHLARLIRLRAEQMGLNAGIDERSFVDRLMTGVRSEVR